MLKDFTKGVNLKKFSITAVVMIVYFMITDMIIHEGILKSTYQATANLWRSEADMKSMMGWMLLSHVMIAVFFTFIFIKGYEGKGWKEGARFGVLMGMFCIGGILMQYVTTAITCPIAYSWAGFGLVQYILGGVVAAKVYKK